MNVISPGAGIDDHDVEIAQISFVTQEDSQIDRDQVAVVRRGAREPGDSGFAHVPCCCNLGQQAGMGDGAEYEGAQKELKQRHQDSLGSAELGQVAVHQLYPHPCRPSLAVFATRNPSEISQCRSKVEARARLD